MNRPHFSTRKDLADSKIDKVQSPMIRYSVTVLLCILICSVGFVFLMFQTDTIFQVNTDELNVTVKNPRVTVTSTTSAVKQDTVDVPGVAPSLSGEWYSSLPTEMQRKGKVVETLNMSDGTLNAYDGLPWDYDSGCYIYNVQVASIDLVNWIDTTAGMQSNLATETKFTFEKSGESCIGTLDGVQVLFSPFSPCVVTQEYNNGFSDSVTGWYQGSTPDYTLYGKFSNGTGRKYCLIVDDSGTTKYIPLAAKDSKGHTFPGGVIQTHLQLASPAPGPDGPFLINVGDTGPRSKSMTIKDIVSQLDTLIADPGGNWQGAATDPLRAYIKNCLEIYGGNGDDCRILSKYEIKGYIVWPN